MRAGMLFTPRCNAEKHGFRLQHLTFVKPKRNLCQERANERNVGYLHGPTETSWVFSASGRPFHRSAGSARV